MESLRARRITPISDVAQGVAQEESASKCDLSPEFGALLCFAEFVGPYECCKLLWGLLLLPIRLLLRNCYDFDDDDDCCELWNYRNYRCWNGNIALRPMSLRVCEP